MTKLIDLAPDVLKKKIKAFDNMNNLRYILFVFAKAVFLLTAINWPVDSEAISAQAVFANTLIIDRPFLLRIS